MGKLEHAAASASAAYRDAGTKAKAITLLTWSALAPWQQDDVHILSGYRPVSNSYIRSALSLGYLHNESVNVWTHLLGAVFFAGSGGLLWQMITTRYSSASASDLFVFGCFFGGTVLCLAFSATFHTLSNHSARVYRRWLFLDFLGILAMIAGSWFPGVYYGFYCMPTTTRAYWMMISMLTAACTSMIVVPACRTPAWKPVRTLMFVALGLSGVVPMVHSAMLFGVAQARAHMGWGWFVLEGIFYALGAGIYANKVPERWWPGKFDIWGSSHQIFHVMVLCGGVAHLVGIVQAFDYNHHPDTRRC